MLSTESSAQKLTLLLFYDSELPSTIKPISKTIFLTENEIKNETQNYCFKLREQGYLEAAVDSIIKNDTQRNVYIHIGKKYSWGTISKGNLEEEVISDTRFREKIWRNKPVNAKSLALLMEKIITYYENNGYPFASVKIDSLKLINNQFKGVLNVTKNHRYSIDSIIIKGDASISAQYIYNQIGIQPKDLYNESVLKEVDIRLKEVPFIQNARASEIIFTENQANLYIYLNKKKASSFNGILGILPDAKTGKITITGDARINLKNAFGKGEVIDLNWRKLNTAIQDLKVNFNYPFIFKSNFGTDFNFKLYKKDSTFLELHKNIGLQYLMKGGNYFKAFYTNNTSDLLTPGMFAFATTLPSFADVSTSLYGIGIKSERLDYKLNPRKGFSLSAEFSAGTKKIKKNPKLNEELYDNVELNSFQSQSYLNAELFIPISKRSTFKIGSNNAYIFNDNLFTNELLRIGGFRNLRGFNEESILASFFSIETIEYRFLLEQNSALYLFFDYAYYEKRLRDSYFSDRPFGFGLGMNFSTNAGIFTINYALGSEQGNPILLRGGKVHFGFVSYF